MPEASSSFVFCGAAPPVLSLLEMSCLGVREVSMRWSKSLIPTVKEDPAEAEAISHKLMIRAGLVRQLAAGIYV